MKNRQYNWENKAERMEQAKKHTASMDAIYADKIDAAVQNTILYNYDFRCWNQRQEQQTEISIVDSDSVAEVIKLGGKGLKTAVLNFSSYRHPGGMFIEGSRAQEECLCHASFLYNVLRETDTFYAWNEKHKNKALYFNRALYSPNIMFFSDKLPAGVECDVITCAAPNKTAAQKYQNVRDWENTEVLKSRINFVLDIAKENEVDVLILGAYGCGVFGQNPYEVAEIFKEKLDGDYARCFSKVVFPIPNRSDGNLKAFQETFQQ